MPTSFPAFALLAGFLAGLGGCVIAPAGPRGPLLGPSLSAAADLSAAYSPGTMTTTQGVRHSGDADAYGIFATIVPPRMELAFSPIAQAELNLRLGWLAQAVEVRAGLPDAWNRTLAFNVSVGIEQVPKGRIADGTGTSTMWARVEFYPRLQEQIPGLPRRRWLVSLGIHQGIFYHQIRYTSLYGTEGPIPSWADVYRMETRVETGVGYWIRGRYTNSLFAIEPYFNLRTGDPRSGSSSEVSRYQQGWGCVVVFRQAVSWNFGE